MIGLFVNPHARSIRRSPERIEALRAVLGESGRLEAPVDPAELVAVARSFKDEGARILALCGGDGTCHRVLTAVAQVYDGEELPPIAMLGGGTMNTIARSIGVNGRPEDLLSKIVNTSAQQLPVVERWLTCVDGEQYGFLFGAGMIAQYLEAYYEGRPGPVRAAWVLARAVLSSLVGGAYGRRVASAIEVQIEVDGQRWPLGRWLTVGVGTVDDLGLGFRAFHSCIDNPGKMHALGIGCSAFALAFQLRHALRAEPFNHPDIYEASARRVVLRASEPLGFSLDGDFHRGGQTLSLSVGPRVRCVVMA